MILLSLLSLCNADRFALFHVIVSVTRYVPFGRYTKRHLGGRDVWAGEITSTCREMLESCNETVALRPFTVWGDSSYRQTQPKGKPDSRYQNLEDFLTQKLTVD